MRTCSICHESVVSADGFNWTHAHSQQALCGTGDGSVAYPEGIDIRRPRNPSELRRFLIIKRPNVLRSLAIDSRAVYSNRRAIGLKAALARGCFDISVHPDSTLSLVVLSGLPFLKLRQGHVEVTFKSIWGNSIELDPGTTAKVIVPSKDTKVTIAGDATGLELVLPEGDKHRVYWPGKYPNGLVWS